MIERKDIIKAIWGVYLDEPTAHKEVDKALNTITKKIEDITGDIRSGEDIATEANSVMYYAFMDGANLMLDFINGNAKI